MLICALLIICLCQIFARDKPNTLKSRCKETASVKVHHWLFREFTINLISNWFVEAANFTSGTFDAGVDEADMCGLTPMPSVKV